MGSPSNKLGTSTVTGRTISHSCWLIKPRVTHTHTACIRHYFGIYFMVSDSWEMTHNLPKGIPICQD